MSTPSTAEQLVHHRRRRRHRRKAVAAMPITPTEKIWMDGELVDWADATVHVLTHTMHYGSGVFEGIRAYPTSRGVAVFRLGDHIRPAVRLGQGLHDRRPLHGRRDHRGHPSRGAGQRHARRLLPPAARLPRLRRDGPQPAAVPGQRLGRRLALGHLPRRRGRGQRRVVQDQLVAAPRPQRRADGGQGHRHVRQLLAGQGRGAQGRLRRGHPARPQRPGQRVHRREHLHRARRRASSRRPPPTPARSTGITQDSVETIARDLGLRGAPRAHHPHRPLPRRRGLPHRHRGRGRADPRRRRPPGRRRARPGRITKEIQQTYFATVRGEVDQYKDWLDHVD